MNRYRIFYTASGMAKIDAMPLAAHMPDDGELVVFAEHPVEAVMQARSRFLAYNGIRFEPVDLIART